MKTSLRIVWLTFIIWTAGCTLFSEKPISTTSPDVVQSQVSALLTSMPTNSLGLTEVNSATPTYAVTVSVTPTGMPEVTPTLTASPLPLPTNTNVPTATATLSPTKTPLLLPTSTVPSSDPALSLGNPKWQDTFKNGDNWPSGEDKFTSINFEDRTLKLTGLTGSDGWRLSWPKINNYYLEVTLYTRNCTKGDRFGVVFRFPDNENANQGYIFGISCDGKFALRKWNGDKMKPLIDWTSSKEIPSGAGVTHRMGILASGNHITLYENGVKLGDINDNSYTEGYFGVFVGAIDTENLTVWISKVAYWDIP